MSPFEPLKTSAVTEAEKVVAMASTIAPQPVSMRAWQHVEAATKPKKTSWKLLLALPVSMAIGLFGVLWLTRQPAPIGAPVEAPKPMVVAATVPVGKTTFTRSNAAMKTPHVSLLTRDARFLAEVTSTFSEIVVEEGEVVVRPINGAAERILHAGESMRWPPAPAETIDPLEAQVALFELGSRQSGDEAIATWRRSLDRFPDGVMHPEVRLRLLEALVKARRPDEAEAVAIEFEKNCAKDPRLSQVRALRAALHDKK